MADSFEDDDNLDVLQNIEFSIVSALETHPDMDDNDAMNAVDILIKDFRDIERGRKPKTHSLSGAVKSVFIRVRGICLLRMQPQPGLGGTQDAPSGDDLIPESALLPPATIFRCLKKIRKSMDRWHGTGGRRGYLEFIRRFFPTDS